MEKLNKKQILVNSQTGKESFMEDLELLNKIGELITDISDEGRRVLTIFVAMEVIKAVDEKRSVSTERLLYLYEQVQDLSKKLKKASPI